MTPDPRLPPIVVELPTGRGALYVTPEQARSWLADPTLAVPPVRTVAP